MMTSIKVLFFELSVDRTSVNLTETQKYIEVSPQYIASRVNLEDYGFTLEYLLKHSLECQRLACMVTTNSLKMTACQN